MSTLASCSFAVIMTHSKLVSMMKALTDCVCNGNKLRLDIFRWPSKRCSLTMSNSVVSTGLARLIVGNATNGVSIKYSIMEYLILRHRQISSWLYPPVVPKSDDGPAFSLLACPYSYPTSSIGYNLTTSNIHSIIIFSFENSIQLANQFKFTNNRVFYSYWFIYYGDV